MSRFPTGIYKITNLKNGKIYVGQSQNVLLRRQQHFTALRDGKHPNREMQADFDHDYRSFRWDLIEYCDISKLNEREHYWIEKLNTIERGYNQGWVPYKRKEKKKSKRKVVGYRRRS